MSRIKIGAALALCVLLALGALGEERDMTVSDAPLSPAYDLPEGFVYVQDVIEDVIQEVRYAGRHNFTGTVVDGYEEPLAIMTEKAAVHLKQAADALREKGYLIKIFDAYRPQRAVRCFMNWSMSEDDGSTRDEFYPDYANKKKLVEQGYIARNSAHTRGSAVDLTLTDLEGNELDMGTCFDFFGKKAWHGAADVTEAQQANRQILLDAMREAGFRPFEQEWWHYKLVGEPFPETSFDFIVH